MKKLSLRVGALLLAGTMSLSALPAQAAEYSDLDWNHWAYEEMTRAVGLGILQGVGGNQLAPSQTMTWGQFLALVTRTFAPEDYQQALNQGAAWDLAGYQAAEEARILRERDNLPVTPDRLGEGITREDAAVLLYRALPDEIQEGYAEHVEAMDFEDLFTDFDQMDSIHQAAVCALSGCGISQGKPDGSFGRHDTIQRCDGAVLLMRTLDVVDRELAGEPVTITVCGVDSQSGSVLFSEEYDAEVGAFLYIQEQNTPQYYVLEGFRGGNTVSSACSTYYIDYRPMDESERAEAEFWERVEQGLATEDEYWTQPFWLTSQGANAAKSTLLFGDPGKYRFDNRAEAQASMTTITVPVWRLSGGVKKSATSTIQVHTAIAEDIKAIFTEIYNDPEQFPINGLSGFRFVEGTSGEHNCGTAIDINANENYQVRDGQAMVGTLWQPGVNPFSIKPDGSVVRIFEAHGWSWGGDAWCGHTDPMTDYHDYMHFSYMGG